MQEIFTNVQSHIKTYAEFIWKLALNKSNPIDAANFLNSAIENIKNTCTEEEIEFLQFYFKMQMEMRMR